MNLYIIVITSAFQNIKLLDDRIYNEAVRDGYFRLETATKDGTEKFLYIFNNLQNQDFITQLVDGYEYVNGAKIYHGPITWLEKYQATEYTGKPIRIKVIARNNSTYDIPLEAKDHLNVEI